MSVGCCALWEYHQREYIFLLILNILNPLPNLLPGPPPALLAIPINIDTPPRLSNGANKRPTLDLRLGHKRKRRITHRDVEDVVPVGMVADGDRSTDGLFCEVLVDVAHHPCYKFAVCVEVEGEEGV